MWGDGIRNIFPHRTSHLYPPTTHSLAPSKNTLLVDFSIKYFLHQTNKCQMFFARQDTTIRSRRRKNILREIPFSSEQLGSFAPNIFIFCIEKRKNPPTSWTTEKSSTCWCTTWLGRFFLENLQQMKSYAVIACYPLCDASNVNE